MDKEIEVEEPSQTQRITSHLAHESGDECPSFDTEYGIEEFTQPNRKSKQTIPGLARSEKRVGQRTIAPTIQTGAGNSVQAPPIRRQPIADAQPSDFYVLSRRKTSAASSILSPSIDQSWIEHAEHFADQWRISLEHACSAAAKCFLIGHPGNYRDVEVVGSIQPTINVLTQMCQWDGAIT
jgi:hypothetical protein